LDIPLLNIEEGMAISPYLNLASGAVPVITGALRL
jgi:hypothetical protein